MKQRDFDKLNMIRARRIMRKMVREDSSCSKVREDYGVKGMKWGDHRPQEEPTTQPKKSFHEEYKEAMQGGNEKQFMDKILGENSYDDIVGKFNTAEKEYSESKRAESIAWKKNKKAEEELRSFNEGYAEYAKANGTGAAEKMKKQMEDKCKDLRFKATQAYWNKENVKKNAQAWGSVLNEAQLRQRKAAHADHGVKGMKWGEHKAEQEEEHSGGRKVGKIAEIKGNKVEYNDGDHAVCSANGDPGLFYVYKKREFQGKESWSLYGLWERSAKDGYRMVDNPRVTANSMDGILKREFGRTDAKCEREDHGVKGMKWGEHSAKEEQSGSASSATLFKTVGEFKQALEDRNARASERELAEHEWKQAKAFRASMFGKSVESLKADIESCKKSGDADGLERAKHDLNRLQNRVKKYGPDYGLGEAQKKYEQAEKAYADIDNKIKEFDKQRRRANGDSKSVRLDYGVKGMKWGEHKAEEEESTSGGSSIPKTENPKDYKTKIKAVDDAQLQSIGKNERGEKEYRLSVPGVCEVYAWTDKRNKNEHSYEFNLFDGSFEGITPTSGSVEDLQRSIKNRVKKVIAEKAKASLHASAQEESKRLGTSTQKIKDDLYVAFSPHTPEGRPSKRAWGKVVDEPTEGYKEYGQFGNFKVYSKGFWGKGDNDSFGYEFVMDNNP